MRVSPMLSPRGTNHEKLFILTGRRMALDAAPEDDNSIDAVVAWARENCDGAGLQMLISKLSELLGPSDDFPEARKPRKLDASDAAKVAYLARFPHANRLKR